MYLATGDFGMHQAQSAGHRAPSAVSPSHRVHHSASSSVFAIRETQACPSPCRSPANTIQSRYVIQVQTPRFFPTIIQAKCLLRLPRNLSASMASVPPSAQCLQNALHFLRRSVSGSECGDSQGVWFCSMVSSPSMKRSAST